MPSLGFEPTTSWFLVLLPIFFFLNSFFIQDVLYSKLVKYIEKQTLKMVQIWLLRVVPDKFRTLRNPQWLGWRWLKLFTDSEYSV